MNHKSIANVCKNIEVLSFKSFDKSKPHKSKAKNLILPYDQWWLFLLLTCKCFCPRFRIYLNEFEIQDNVGSKIGCNYPATIGIIGMIRGCQNICINI